MFKKFFKPKFLLIFFIVASLSLPALIGLAYYGSSYSTGYQIMSQEKGAIITINSSGVRKMINSNSSISYFIPTRTSDEWNRFVAAAPGLGVTVVSEFCGDGTCGTDRTNPALPRVETYSWCPADCSAPYCGDGTCNGTETTYNCTVDCGQPCYFTESCPGYPGDFSGYPACTGADYTCVLNIPPGSQPCLVYPGDQTDICLPDYCPSPVNRGVCTWIGTLPPAYY